MRDPRVTVRARSLAVLVSALLLTGVTADPALAAAVKAPAKRLPVACSKVVPSATIKAVVGTRAKPTDVYGWGASARTIGPWYAAYRESGLLGCAWKSSGAMFQMQALPEGERGFAAAKRQLQDDKGVQIGKGSVLACSAGSCLLELLVGHVWVDAYLSDGAKSQDTTLAHARTLTRAIQKALKPAVKGAPWKMPSGAWKVPSSCEVLDPDDAIGAAAGASGIVDQGDLSGNDTLIGSEVVARAQLHSCIWIRADGDVSVVAVMTPGASWARPAGSAVKPSSIGSGVKSAVWNSGSGLNSLDVVADGGWFRLSGNADKAHLEAAARLLLQRLRS